MTATRLDTELVRRGLVRSRTQAARLIATQRVSVAGKIVTKAAASIDESTSVAIEPGEPEWASRGAHKLLGALDAFRIEAAGRRALDAGASTGGFTDVLLRRGAAAVASVDVGDGQLDPRLAADPRVLVVDRTNLREISAATEHRIREFLGGAPQLVVADLSFISLTLVLPALIGCAAPDADVVPMVKPQFEVGKGRLGAHGVVRDPVRRCEAVMGVAEVGGQFGWGVAAVTASPLPGPAGNVEYFLHLRTDAPVDTGRARSLIETAVRGGPQ